MFVVVVFVVLFKFLIFLVLWRMPQRRSAKLALEEIQCYKLKQNEVFLFLFNESRYDFKVKKKLKQEISKHGVTMGVYNHYDHLCYPACCRSDCVVVL